MSDVVVKLNGNEQFTLFSARNPGNIVSFIQDATKNHWHHGVAEDEREPFDILVDTLSDVVKWHLTTRGKEYITRDYVEKLDDTLTVGKPIDLRTEEEKIIIESWKTKYKKKEDSHDDDEHHEEHEEGHH